MENIRTLIEYCENKPEELKKLLLIQNRTIKAFEDIIIDRDKTVEVHRKTIHYLYSKLKAIDNKEPEKIIKHKTIVEYEKLKPTQENRNEFLDNAVRAAADLFNQMRHGKSCNCIAKEDFCDECFVYGSPLCVGEMLRYMVEYYEKKNLPKERLKAMVEIMNAKLKYLHVVFNPLEKDK